MYAKLFLRSTILALLLFPLCYKPLPASAMTGEEFVKLFGVVDRYIQDLHKTFGTPSSEPQAPAPETESTPTVPELSPNEEGTN